MNEILEGSQTHELITKGLSPTPYLETIRTDRRNENSFTGRYVFEVKEDMEHLCEKTWGMKPVDQRLVGFWMSAPIVGYYYDGEAALVDLGDLTRARRVEVTTYEYEPMYD